MRQQLCFMALLVALGGCSGGNAGAPIAAVPKPSPNEVAKLTIALPYRSAGAAGRNPQFVSPSTQSLSVAVNGGAPQPFNLTGSSAVCSPPTGSTYTCTVNVAAPITIAPFIDSFFVTLYDATNAGGNALGSGLGSGSVTASGGTITVTIAGIVHSIQATLGSTTIVPRVASSTSLSVVAKDVDGNVISGAYASPVTLTSNDASNSIVVSPSSITSAGQTATVTYNGSTLVFGGSTITPSGSGVPSSQAPPVTLTSTTPCAPQFTPKNLYVSWDTGPTNNVVMYPGPAYSSGTPLSAGVTNPVFMSLDPAGNMIFSQANTPNYTGLTANVAYIAVGSLSTPYSGSLLTPITPTTYNIQGSGADDKGDVFVAGTPSMTSIAGFYEITSALTGGTTVIPINTSQPAPYSVRLDKYCNLFADGRPTSGPYYLDIFGTNGQSGGGYGQIPPIINTQVPLPAAMAFDSKNNLYFGTPTGIAELPPPYTGAPVPIITSLSGAFIPALAIDASDTMIFGNYASDNVYESMPPYSSATFMTGLSGHLSFVIGVAIGP